MAFPRILTRDRSIMESFPKIQAPGELFRVLRLFESIANTLFSVKFCIYPTSIISRLYPFVHFNDAFLEL